ncbi:hypothetical protein B0O80DRAFT_498406 [Mortierella sp. GBAus27b]|nr:hypothetical protein BGX31_006102 [Mortierella sp. GBA43]KAI8354396.1 hypothetical protein B0O80DRAFT_498406 [Mortierella sp. GBAus27b]
MNQPVQDQPQDSQDQLQDQPQDQGMSQELPDEHVAALATSTIPTPSESTESTPPGTQAERSGDHTPSSPSAADEATSTQDQQKGQQSQPSKPPPHISGSLCKKTPEEIIAIVGDKKALAADLRNYSNEFVLTSARDRVINEVDEQGKELLQDVDPERDIIKQRFEDESSVFKSYDDAIHDVRIDLYLEGIKPRKLEAEENSEEAAKNAELSAVLQVWDTFHKRVDVEPRRGGRVNQTYYPGRGPPGSRPHPYASARFPGSPPAPASYGPPGANEPPSRDSRSHSRGYPDRPPYRDEFYPDRRDDYRRPDYDRRDPREMGMRPQGPGPMGRSDPRDMRDPRDFRERPPAGRLDGPYGPGGRYDERRRDRPDLSNAPPPRDGRHSGPASAAASPLTSHPSLPPKPQGSHYDTAPVAHLQHAGANPLYHQHYPPAHQQLGHVDPQSAQGGYAAYGYPQQYPVPGQPDYSGYAYAGYGHDPASLAAQQQYAYSAGGWDMSANMAATGIQLQPFTSSQPGRHKAVPLPTDFMSGPSDAPRLSMPEPHEVLGTIRGVIIRDAHGNIGLSQYHFTQATQ